MIRKWGWGDGDFTISSWFRGSFRNGSGDPNQTASGSSSWGGEILDFATGIQTPEID
eukprot:SAG31_NODE_14098_length_827_cov_1.409341_2_plen_56_part_01